MEQRVGSGYLKATLVALATSYDGRPVHRKQLAIETGLAVYTISRHFKLLEALGFISKTRGYASPKMEASS